MTIRVRVLSNILALSSRDKDSGLFGFAQYSPTKKNLM